MSLRDSFASHLTAARRSIVRMRAFSSPTNHALTSAADDGRVPHRPFHGERATLVAPFVLALLAADALFIVLNVVRIDDDGQRRLWRLLWVGREWSLPEIMQYAKWALMAVALALACRRSREPVYGAWGVAFAAMGVDDAFSLHEVIGRSLSALSPGALAGRSGYFELVPMAVGALALLLALWWAHRRGPAATVRRYSLVTLILVGIYGIFAVGVDGFHSLVGHLAPGDRISNVRLLLLEDGGELLALTILVGHTLRHLAHRYGSHGPLPSRVTAC